LIICAKNIDRSRTGRLYSFLTYRQCTLDDNHYLQLHVFSVFTCFFICQYIVGIYRKLIDIFELFFLLYEFLIFMEVLEMLESREMDYILTY
jgi:hypothetical protein